MEIELTEEQAHLVAELVRRHRKQKQKPMASGPHTRVAMHEVGLCDAILDKLEYEGLDVSEGVPS